MDPVHLCFVHCQHIMQLSNIVQDGMEKISNSTRSHGNSAVVALDTLKIIGVELCHTRFTWLSRVSPGKYPIK